MNGKGGRVEGETASTNLGIFETEPGPEAACGAVRGDTSEWKVIGMARGRSEWEQREMKALHFLLFPFAPGREVRVRCR
jgi:hypothetical protein